MKTILRDHGQILHWAGAHQLFPVRGPGADEIGFASHGATEGRTPIGWNVFFPLLEGDRRVIVADDEAGTATVSSEAAARAELGPARTRASVSSEGTQDPKAG